MSTLVEDAAGGPVGNDPSATAPEYAQSHSKRGWKQCHCFPVIAKSRGTTPRPEFNNSPPIRDYEAQTLRSRRQLACRADVRYPWRSNNRIKLELATLRPMNLGQCV